MLDIRCRLSCSHCLRPQQVRSTIDIDTVAIPTVIVVVVDMLWMSVGRV